MHPANLEGDTTIWFAPPARDTGPAIEIRDHRHRIPRRKTRRPVQIHQVPRQLMTQDTRILEIRLCPLESMQIRPADPYPPDLDDRLPPSPQGRIHPPILQPPRFYTNQPLHKNPAFASACPGL